MPLALNNSLTKKKEIFKPLKDKTVNMYTCGVTVYDKSHIGHARSLYVFDVMRRHLEYKGFHVNFIRNITDIDDKIINRAKEEGRNWQDVSREFTVLYKKDLKDFRIGRENDSEPKATENIEDMITHIQGLIEKGYAYEAEGDVYFRVRKFKNYGKLSGQSIEDIMEAVRIERDEKKEDPLDFALWKKSKDNEEFWNSPWGNGRPGWHIECSVMSLKKLGCETLDIHGGGRDLIFPHHENEIAQAEALTGKPFARYWVHHGLLTINSQKMSKSLGNFITMQDALSKYPIDDLKLFFLASHYASPVDFSDKKMADAHKTWERISIFLSEADRLVTGDTEIPAKTPSFIETKKEEFINAMDDDFNTPRSLGCLFELINETYQHKEKSNYSGILHLARKTVLELLREVFGIFQEDSMAKEAIDEIVQDLLNKRINARKNKDFKRSDEIRDTLKEKGIIVEDTKEGQIWRRA